MSNKRSVYTPEFKTRGTRGQVLCPNIDLIERGINEKLLVLFFCNTYSLKKPINNITVPGT